MVRVIISEWKHRCHHRRELTSLSGCRENAAMQLPDPIRSSLLLAILVLGITVSSGATAGDEAEGLREGWKWRTTIPALKFEDVVVNRESRVTLWVEQGWLVVRRATVDDEFEWQVVLARAANANRPQIKVNESTRGLEVSYRGY